MTTGLRTALHSWSEQMGAVMGADGGGPGVVEGVGEADGVGFGGELPCGEQEIVVVWRYQSDEAADCAWACWTRAVTWSMSGGVAAMVAVE